MWHSNFTPTYLPKINENYVHKTTYMQMSGAALFAIARNQKSSHVHQHVNG